MKHLENFREKSKTGSQSRNKIEYCIYIYIILVQNMLQNENYKIEKRNDALKIILHSIFVFYLKDFFYFSFLLFTIHIIRLIKTRLGKG